MFSFIVAGAEEVPLFSAQFSSVRFSKTLSYMPRSISFHLLKLTEINLNNNKMLCNLCVLLRHYCSLSLVIHLFYGRKNIWKFVM